MLKHLNVRQFAIIENIEVDFETGMNVLSGETGAGKSLLIDAIGLLLGDRASNEIIRTGEEFAEITAIFEPVNDTVKQTLEALDIPVSSDELLIKRRIKKNSGNLIKVNHETVTLQDLKKITVHLADIHTQSDTERLINPDNYLDLIDRYDAETKSYKDAYQATRRTYLAALAAYEELKDEKATMLEKMDMLRFQAEEIAAHNLKEDELEAIEARLKTLQNFDVIFQAVKNAHGLLDESGALEQIYDAASALENVTDYDADYRSLKERIEAAYYELDDVRSTLAGRLEILDFDPDELEELETRKHTLDTLRRKYHREIGELIAYQKEIEEKIAAFSDYDETLEGARIKAEQAYRALIVSAKELREKRQKTAHAIENRLKEELSDLELKDASFKVVFETVEPESFTDRHAFMKNGTSKVDFHLSTNKGEPMKPLRKIASGGELSRIMLALKTLLVSEETLNLVIFDEIDTGVSGYVAGQVARKMHAIARDVQVLAITHLPQVAAKADHHYHIYKTSDENRTKTHLRLLDHEARIEHLASMISSDKVTKSALESARELLK